MTELSNDGMMAYLGIGLIALEYAGPAGAGIAIIVATIVGHILTEVVQ